MKGFAAICVCALVLGCQAAQSRDVLSPITRVVTLLQSLSKQIEKEGKAEKDLYESFVCWGNSVIAQKTESNTAANSRSASLGTYIGDLDGGKVELTTDRVDREKELAELRADIATALKLRNKEAADFAAAEQEMIDGKTALKAAIDLLSAATAGKTFLLAEKSELNAGLASMEAESAHLNKAVELGDRFLSKGDSFFLRRLLNGYAPAGFDPAGANLRKKASFKMSYKARSTNIQATLAKLHATFKKNLEDAQEKERDAIALYGVLSGSKGRELATAQSAVSTLAVENGAQGVAKGNAEKEKGALDKQVIDDDRFISETTESLRTKKIEYDERVRLRELELAAISQAEGILRNDDNRDNERKSYSSQGYGFLQVSSQSKKAKTLFGRAATHLKRLARETGDSRIAALAVLAATSSQVPTDKFTPVIQDIDIMIGNLGTADTQDLQKKETCESTRRTDTRAALVLGKALDDKTDTMSKLTGEVADLDAQVAQLKADKVTATDELIAATTLRGKTNANYLITDQEDREAAETVASAKLVLTTYYTTNFPALLQKKSAALVQKQPAVVDGEAPPPPPATWAVAAYGGKKDEQAGIIGIMEMVHADILKDKALATTEEAASLSEYNEYKRLADLKIVKFGEDIGALEGQSGGKVVTRDGIEGQQNWNTKKGQWDVLMKKIKDADPHCEYYTENYKLRVANRQVERVGLQEAKAILNGGSFADR